jgi:hypothetical protein
MGNTQVTRLEQGNTSFIGVSLERLHHTVFALDDDLNILTKARITTMQTVHPFVLSRTTIIDRFQYYNAIYNLETGESKKIPKNLQSYHDSSLERVDDNSFLMDRKNKKEPYGLFLLDTSYNILWSCIPPLLYKICVLNKTEFISLSEEGQIQLWRIPEKEPICTHLVGIGQNERAYKYYMIHTSCAYVHHPMSVMIILEQR